MHKFLALALASACSVSHAHTPATNPMPDGSRDMFVGLGLVSAPLYEGAHDRFELVLAHLTVPNYNACIRTKLSNAFGDAFDRLNAVMKEIHLPAAQALPFDGIAKNSLIVSANDRLNGLPIRWRGFDE